MQLCDKAGDYDLMVCFRRLFFREKLFRRVLSAPSFYVAFGTDRDIAPPSRYTEPHVSLAMMIAIRVGMAMMEVVVTDLKHFSNISE